MSIKQGAKVWNHLPCEVTEYEKSASLSIPAENIDCHLFVFFFLFIPYHTHSIPTAIECEKSSITKMPMNNMLQKHQAYQGFVSILFWFIPSRCYQKKNAADCMHHSLPSLVFLLTDMWCECQFIWRLILHLLPLIHFLLWHCHTLKLFDMAKKAPKISPSG